MEDLIIAENETRQTLVNVINDSGLPACILEPILKNLYEQILKEKERQLNEALQIKEQKELAEKEKEKNKKKEVKENE